MYSNTTPGKTENDFRKLFFLLKIIFFSCIFSFNANAKVPIPKVMSGLERPVPDLVANETTLNSPFVIIKGTVKGPKGNFLEGVSVTVKGTSIGTITNSKGEFSVNAPKENSILVFQFVGMQPVEIAGSPGMNVVMQDGNKLLEEVLVIAYGKIKKSDFTGSATEIDASKLSTPAASFDKGLTGKIAGVQVVSASGQPGSGTTIRIRGAGSLKASNAPLYVIDGVAVSSYSDNEYSEIASENSSTSNPLATINPNDIQSITVLKDAVAASLYGSRAANGVVLITTKSGKSGKTKVSLTVQNSSATLPKSYKTVNSAEYYKLLLDAYIRAGSDAIEANQKTQGTLTHNPYNVDQPLDANGNITGNAKIVINTDWQDAVFSTAQSQDYVLNISGGTDKSDYFFSGGYSDQKGIAPSSSFKRYSGLLKLNTQATPWLKAGMNVSFSSSIQNTTVAGSAGASPLYNAIGFPNAVPIYVVDVNGNPVLNAAGEKQYNFTNPVNLDFNPLAIPYMDVHRSKFYRVLTSGYVDVDLYKGLSFKTNLSADFLTTDEHRYWNKEHGNGPAYNGRLDKYHHTDLAYTSTNILSYNQTFGGVHNLNAIGGMEFWKSTFETLYAGGRDLLGNMQELSAAGGSFSPSSNTTEETLISYLGRVEYAYADKYNVSASLRSDGSSVFGLENKWGTFWSTGISWKINQEDFMKDLNYLDNLKLRVSYGKSGNKGGLSRYASLGLWTASADYLYGNNTGVGHQQLANAALSWEKQGMFNAGLDFGFQKRIYGSVDYFVKKSDGLLYDFPLAISNGFSSILLNAAKTTNSGFEFVLGANILRGEFRWSADLNASIIRDKIENLNGDNDVPITIFQKIWSVGGSQFEFNMPTWAGVNPQTGSPQWYTTDANGQKATTDVYSKATYERQGRSTPDLYGGLTNNFTYKRFDLSVQINYTLGGKFYDGLYATMMHDGSKPGRNMHVDALNAWNTVGQKTNVPLFSINNPSGSSSLSSRFLYSATNVNFKNITLSYGLPMDLGRVSNVISGGRVYVSVDNLYTWFSDKGYKGYNDIDIFGVQGYSLYPSMPVPRTFSLGINLTF